MVAATAVAATERPTGMQRPDASGRFGKYGGKYVPETLITALAELEAAYAETKNDASFKVIGARWIGLLQASWQACVHLLPELYCFCSLSLLPCSKTM